MIANCEKCGFSRSVHPDATWLGSQYKLQKFGSTEGADEKDLSVELGFDHVWARLRVCVTNGDLDRGTELRDDELLVTVLAAFDVPRLPQGFSYYGLPKILSSSLTTGCCSDLYWIGKSESPWKAMLVNFACGFVAQKFCKLCHIDRLTLSMSTSLSEPSLWKSASLNDFTIRSPA